MSIATLVGLGIVLLVVLLSAGLAPTPTARVIPTGYKMPDGFKTTVTFASVPNLLIWEVTVKPPGYDGGEKIDTTTMLNVEWRTFSPRHLKTLSECPCTGAYDPMVYNTLRTLVNKEDTITIEFPDHVQISFYGVMTKFEAPEHKEGEFPVANIQIEPTNWDPVNFVEAGPVITASGTA